MEKKYKVKNRSGGMVAYTIPELGDARNIRREFAVSEVKEIPAKELEALTFIGGGRTLLEDYLQILDAEGLNFVNLQVEPEYAMNEEDIKNLLLYGSYDKFLDTLDFAPEGVIDLIKHYAVALPCNDTAKRDALKDKFGFDVDKVLSIQKAGAEDNTNNTTTTTTTKQRRVAIEEPATVPARPKYNIVG